MKKIFVDVFNFCYLRYNEVEHTDFVHHERNIYSSPVFHLNKYILNGIKLQTHQSKYHLKEVMNCLSKKALFEGAGGIQALNLHNCSVPEPEQILRPRERAKGSSGFQSLIPLCLKQMH